MKYSYYPGCTLKTKATELDECGRKSAEALGFELCEVEDWQCCGAVYPQAKDEIATRLSSVRALMAARDREEDLVTLCSACYHVIKRVNNDMKNNDDIRTKVNNYLKPENIYAGETTVLHYLEVLRDKVGFDEIAKKVVKPFTGRKIAAYYGCLLLRPGKVMQFDNPENPSIIEDFIKAIGGEPVLYPYRNECCGGYVRLENAGLANDRSNKIVASAKENGAEIIITACPLCMYNLKTANHDEDISVNYFTELLAEALGL